MARKKAANLLVEVLAGAGVRRIYAFSGDSLNAITDSIARPTIFSGFVSDMKKRPPLPQARKRISQVHWRSARAAVRGTGT